MPDENSADAAEAQKKAAEEAAVKAAADAEAAKQAAAKTDPHAAELEVLRAAKTKDDALIQEKNQALKAERDARKQAEADVEKLRGEGNFITKQEAEEMVKAAVAEAKPGADVVEQAKQAAQEVAQADRRSRLIEQAGATPSERELITHHLDNTVKPSGDLAVDVQRAKMLANEAVLRKIAQDGGSKHAQDAALANLLGLSGGARLSGEPAVAHPVETVTLAKAIGLDPAKLPKK